ncbi:SSrecog-domain-containing protein [Thelephora ganbajun]|uniref:SSrecog-domain-containing protein n=1 Tax=Thelephora ganbajun TaxID=370292 RepID=A0ACB6YZL7_THEGA|nr:SSrecog-domain-containing protein [Thelephora ganbajun]
MATTQFDGIYCGLSPEVGTQSGVGWKGEESAATKSIPSTDIKWVQWLRVARNYQIRVALKDGTRTTFDGFSRDNHDKLVSLFKQHFSVQLESKEVSFRGWNWGSTDFQGQDLAFLVGNKTAFELPLQFVANSNIAGRTEVSLEFQPQSLTKSKPSKYAPDEMAEIRFYVPGTQAKSSRSDAGSQKSDAEDEGEEISAAQAFHNTIKERAEIGQATGDIILSFEEVLVLTPRGRYDVDLYHDFFRLRGKTYDYKIVYSTILKLFLLPKDDLHVLFIMGLGIPIQQGQTRYQYLVMQFTREEETTAELNMTEYVPHSLPLHFGEEVATYDRMKKQYEDPTFEVVSGIFRALSKKKIVGAGSFQSNNGHPSVKANLKAVQGDLFLLEKYVFFVSKQPVLIELVDIYQVVFSRLGRGMGASASRSFDLKITTKSGPEYVFSSIIKEEKNGVEAYLIERKVRVKNEKVPEEEIVMAGDDEDEDEEMASIASGSDVEKAKPKKSAGADLDSEEEDDDFEASASDSGSPTDTDSDGSGGETASDASGDRDVARGAKKALKKSAKKGKGKAADGEDTPAKKPAKKKKAKADKDEDAMDVDESEGEKSKPKPKPKPKVKVKAKGVEEDGPVKKKQKTG